ncbi:caveolin-3-like [Morone saxatilis]|uniref:caveolin-3-like n=1 Tax=Morone saxatilis TaxID=34816 RepID=UPI0015E1E710|nr:caveolin-3-like [Morone saxatilis]
MDETDRTREPLISREDHTRETDHTNRDPNQINEDLIKINFEDVIAEPAGIHSLDCVWKCSRDTFTVSKCWFYRILTAILGIPLSLLWGLLFACMSFCRIWAIVPCMKTCAIQFHCLWKPYLLILRFLVQPVFDAMGKIFRGAKGVLRKEA